MLSGLLLLSALLGEASPTSTGCGSNPPFLGTSRSMTISVLGQRRTYRLFVPSGYNRNSPAPVIYSFHGWYGTGRGQESDTGFSTLCASEGCIAVYPDGDSNNSGGVPGWNSTGSAVGHYEDENGDKQYICDTAKAAGVAPCPYSCGGCDNDCIWGSCTDDRAFLTDIMDYIEATFCVDLDRVYVDGMSNGALFMWEVSGSDLNSRFAAGVSASGNPHVGFNKAPPIESSGTHYSVLDVHGSWDRTVPANSSNGKPYATDGDWYYTLVDEVMEKYGEANGCSEISGIRTYPNSVDNNVWCREMYDCPSGVDVVRCSWRGGHTWPKPYAQFAWNFMKSHPRIEFGSTKKKSSGSLPAPPQSGGPSATTLNTNPELLTPEEKKFPTEVAIAGATVGGLIALLGSAFAVRYYCVRRKSEHADTPAHITQTPPPPPPAVTEYTPLLS